MDSPAAGRPWTVSSKCVVRRPAMAASPDRARGCRLCSAAHGEGQPAVGGEGIAVYLHPGIIIALTIGVAGAVQGIEAERGKLRKAPHGALSHLMQEVLD